MTGLSYRLWEAKSAQPTDAPALVLIHGLGSTQRVWEFVAPLLAEQFRVVAYDQRGHGLSAKPGDGYPSGAELDTITADLRELVTELNLGPPFLVGHSWGATVALAYAGAYPQECPAIALVDGGLVEMRDIAGCDTWEAVSTSQAPTDLSGYCLADMIEETKGRGLDTLPESFIEEFLRAMLDEQPDGALHSRLSHRNYMRILRTIWDTRPESLLRKVECPTLIITALSDAKDEAQQGYNNAKLLGVARAERILPRYKSVLMPDTIHDIPLQRPQRLAEEIRNYFTGGG